MIRHPLSTLKFWLEWKKKSGLKVQQKCGRPAWWHHLAFCAYSSSGIMEDDCKSSKVLASYHSFSSSLLSLSPSSSPFFSWSRAGDATGGGGRSRRAHVMASDFLMATSILAAIMLTALWLTFITCKDGDNDVNGDRSDRCPNPDLWTYPPQANLLLKLLLALKDHADVQRGAVCVHVAQLGHAVLGVDGDDDLRASLVPVESTWHHLLALNRVYSGAFNVYV